MTDRATSGHGQGVRVCSQDPPERPTGTDQFEAIYRRYYGFVSRTLKRFGVPEGQVDDATQDVFLVVHRRHDDYEPSVPPRSWLYGIARRVAANVHRRRRRRRRRLQAVPSPPSSTELDRWLAQQEAAEFVEAFVDRLGSNHGEVFVLIELERMSAPEVAEALGIKLNTVYSRLRSARHKFERAVARHHARQEREHE